MWTLRSRVLHRVHINFLWTYDIDFLIQFLSIIFFLFLFHFIHSNSCFFMFAFLLFCFHFFLSFFLSFFLLIFLSFRGGVLPLRKGCSWPNLIVFLYINQKVSSRNEIGFHILFLFHFGGYSIYIFIHCKTVKKLDETQNKVVAEHILVFLVPLTEQS